MDNRTIAPVIKHNYLLYLKNNKDRLDLIAETIDRLELDGVRLSKNIVQINESNPAVFLHKELPDTSSVVGHYIAKNKFITKTILAEANIAIPDGKIFSVDDFDLACQWLVQRAGSVVVKPIGGTGGQYIYVDIDSKEKLKVAWERISSRHHEFIIEDMIEGDEHRILVVDDKFVAATKRTPLTIVGDGKHSVKELIQIKNSTRQNNLETASKKQIEITPEILALLEIYNLLPGSIIENNKSYQLTEISNVGAGGEHEDITEKVHPGFIQIVQRLTKLLPKMNHIGIDLIAEDISLSPQKQQWSVLEINSVPSLKHHHFPVYGEPRDVFSKVIEASIKFKKQLFHKQRKSYKENIAPVYDYRIENLISEKQPSHKALIIQAAKKRNIVYQKIDHKLWALKSNDKSCYFINNIPDTTSTVAHRCCYNRERGKIILNHSLVHTPLGASFNKTKLIKAWNYARTLNLPVTIKPCIISEMGGVITNINDKENFLDKVKNLNSKRFIVEETIPGQDYRILVIQGAFVAAAMRIPANVIGDGKHSLKDLIVLKNIKRSQDNPYLGRWKLKLSSQSAQQLSQKGISLSTILDKDQIVLIQNISNLSTGCDTADVTDKVHQSFKNISSKVWQAFPIMHYCSISLTTTDISESSSEQRWAVTDIKCNPDISIHHFPAIGKPRDVAGVLVDSLL